MHDSGAQLPSAQQYWQVHAPTLLAALERVYTGDVRISAAQQREAACSTGARLFTRNLLDPPLVEEHLDSFVHFVYTHCLADPVASVREVGVHAFVIDLCVRRPP